MLYSTFPMIPSRPFSEIPATLIPIDKYQSTLKTLP
jgi:hypothetical protein